MSHPDAGAAWAKVGFFTLAVATNLLYVVVCHYPTLATLSLLTLVLFVVVPLNLLVGGAWAVESIRRRGLISAWPLVIVLSALPLFTQATLWPLRMGFWLARPALDQMVEKARAGEEVKAPTRAGPFYIGEVVLGSARDRVELLTNPNRSHPSGFVREAEDDSSRGRFRSPQGDSVVMTGSNLRIHLGGRWWFLEDD